MDGNSFNFDMHDNSINGQINPAQNQGPLSVDQVLQLIKVAGYTPTQLAQLESGYNGQYPQGFHSMYNMMPGNPNVASPGNSSQLAGGHPITRHKFSTEEDEQLRRLVQEYGTSNWKAVASQTFGQRTPRQCRERWKNYLAPHLQSSPWGPEEDKLLQQYHTQYGNQWSQIAKFFPGRTDINIKNHWTTLSNRLHKEERLLPKQAHENEPQPAEPISAIQISIADDTKGLPAI